MKRMLWLDVETTGLDLETCILLQVGAFVTNENLEIEDGAEFEMCMSKESVEDATWVKGFKWNRFAYQMHTTNGLLDQMDQENDTVVSDYNVLDSALYDFIVSNNAVNLPIAGRNPGFDRAFIDKFCRRSSLLFHSHFNFDLRTLKLLMPSDFFERHNYPHTALADIRHDLDDARQLAFKLDLI